MYWCPECGMGYRALSRVNLHRRREHRGRTVLCRRCGIPVEASWYPTHRNACKLKAQSADGPHVAALPLHHRGGGGAAASTAKHSRAVPASAVAPRTGRRHVLSSKPTRGAAGAANTTAHGTDTAPRAGAERAADALPGGGAAAAATGGELARPLQHRRGSFGNAHTSARAARAVKAKVKAARAVARAAKANAAPAARDKVTGKVTGKDTDKGKDKGKGKGKDKDKGKGKGERKRGAPAGAGDSPVKPRASKRARSAAGATAAAHA